MGPRSSRHIRFASLATAVAALLPATVTLAQQPGEVDSELKISQTSGGFAGDLDNDDRFGGAVALVGDLDGDGRNDLLVGAPRDDDGAAQAGALWVLFLNADGSVRDTRKISATQGGLDAALHENDHFGSSVAALGDVDGDGVPDAAVGIPDADVGSPQAGLVRILFLHADGTVKSSLAIGSGKGGFPGTLHSNDDFGFAVAGLGDLDHDGIPDLAVGAVNSGDDDNSEESKDDSVWVLFLKADGSVRAATRIGEGKGGFGGSLSSHDEFGSALALVGDVDGDGLPELAVGAPGDDDGAGAVWMLHLNTDGTTQGQTLIASGKGGLPTPLAKGDQFGRALAATGDIDNDGHDDLAVGLPDADEGGKDRGAVRLLLLATDSTVSSQIVISGLQGGFGGALDNSDEFGIAAAAAPVDPGTGHARMFVGAWRDDDGGSNFGATWVLDLVGITGSQPYAPFIETITGQAGQPAILVPPPPSGDDFIGDPVVVVPTKGGNVSVQEITSSANFVEFNENATYDTGLNPVAALTADFTSDAQPDILTANGDGDSISLLVQQSALVDAGGTFAPKVDITLPFDNNPVALRAGDMDGDGDVDAVVAGDAGLTTFLGNGHGALVAAAFAPVGFLADLQLGDLDGDGDLDVVSASGAPAPGPGSEIGFATSLLNDGTGHLHLHATFASGKAVATVLLANFDGAGKLDALLAIHELDGGPGGVPQGRINLWVGDGAGGFSPSPVFAGFAEPNADGVHPRWGTVGDVNNDGRPDALYTSNDSLAFPAGSFSAEQPPLVLTLLLGTPAGGLLPSTIPTAYAGKGVVPLLHDIAPVPGDGLPDCIVVWTQDALAGDVDDPAGSTQPLTFLAALVGDGLGGFTDASPNQFLGSKEPGDVLVAEVATAADDAAGGPDLLIPDQATRSLDVWLGDGAGQVNGPIVVPNVDPIDESALPAGGIWQGGPRSAIALDLDGDPHPDVAIYSRWDDLAGLFASQAGFVTRHGDGTGQFTGGENKLLPRAGELAGGDFGGDGVPDIAVTLRTDGSGDTLALFSIGGGGALVQPPLIVPAPAGYELTGGLELADVNGLTGDEVLTSGRLGTAGALVVVSKVNGLVRATPYPLGADWDEVRSLSVGLIDGDGFPDVALGLADGRLVLARGTGGGNFEPLVTGATAAAVGGGALRVTEVNGDGHADIVSSTSAKSGKLDQAFVRELLGAGNGAFQVVTLPGLSSVGADGALRPGTADLDGDGATDLVLPHGGSGNVSLLLNQLGTFETFGAGKPGTGGVVPHFGGQGYTTLGGAVSLSLTGGLGGAPALLWIGSGPTLTHPPYAMQDIAAVLPIVLSGGPGAVGAGTGSWSVSTHLPNIVRFAGVELVLQIAVADPGAVGPGPSGAAFSNGLSFTILP